MTDYTSFADTPVSPARSIRAVTPNDNNDLPNGVCKFIFVLTDGNLEVMAANDTASVTIAVKAGMQVPVMAKRILAGTSADVVACY